LEQVRQEVADPEQVPQLESHAIRDKEREQENMVLKERIVRTKTGHVILGRNERSRWASVHTSTI